MSIRVPTHEIIRRVRFTSTGLLVLLVGCSYLRGNNSESTPPVRSAPLPRTVTPAAAPPAPAPATDSASVKTRAKEKVPATPRVTAPRSLESIVIRRRALNARGVRIVVSTQDRALWVLKDSTVLLAAPVAVGRQQGFTYAGKRYDFRTPVGERKVLAKGLNPIWIPPDWHYFEKVVERKLIPVYMKPGVRVRLSDSTHIEMRANQLGRVNRFGNFAPFDPANEIIFDGKIFVPPLGSAQRRVPEVLGTHKLEMADSYLIHGTNEIDSIGEPVSHGCVRMYNEDIERVYRMVPVGTPVYIY